VTFEVDIRNAAGQLAPLERTMTISLRASSSTGQFRATGTSIAITEITIPAGGTSGSFDFVEPEAGTVQLTASADGASSAVATLTVAPSGPSGVGPLEIGLAGGASAGLIAGAAIGWLLARRRKRNEPPAATPPSTPGQPPEGG
jgi:hypothetical protein